MKSEELRMRDFSWPAAACLILLPDALARKILLKITLYEINRLRSRYAS